MAEPGKHDEQGRELQDVRQAFGDKTVEFVRDEDGEIYVTAKSLGRALGYENPGKSVGTIYSRNADELAQHRSFITVMNGNTTSRVTVYSERGAYLIGMLSSTKWAKSFRLWLAKTCEKLRRGEHRIYSTAYVEDLERKLAESREINLAQARLARESASLHARALALYGASKRRNPELHNKHTTQILMFRPPQIEALPEDCERRPRPHLNGGDDSLPVASN